MVLLERGSDMLEIPDKSNMDFIGLPNSWKLPSSTFMPTTLQT